MGEIDFQNSDSHKVLGDVFLESPDTVHGRMREGAHLAGYSLQRTLENLRWLLEDGRYKELSPGYSNVNDFLRDTADAFKLLKIDPTERKEIARLVKAAQPEASHRAIADMVGVTPKTIGADLGVEYSTGNGKNQGESVDPGVEYSTPAIPPDDFDPIPIERRKRAKEMRQMEKDIELQQLVKQAENVKFSDRWSVFTGDIHNTELEPNSIDAIITDPPYPKDDLPLWGALGRFAKRHLRVGGVLLAMTGSLYLPTIIDMLGKHLTYQWVLACVLPGQHSEVHAAWVNNQMWKAVLVYRNGGDLVNIGSDLFENDKRDKNYHDWGQGVGGYKWQIERFTKPNDLICDPFLGGGTTGVAALAVNRRFVGFDNDREKVNIAKGRIGKTLLENEWTKEK